MRSWIDWFARPSRRGTPSRAIVVLGMHRSGTSAIARGLQALGVDLGDDFLEAQPENPTGYWEDKGIVDLNERALRALGSAWDAAAPLVTQNFETPRLRKLRRTAAAYVRRKFERRRLWGFKDPRTLRLLPLWLAVLETSRIDDAYLLVVRNPMSVAKSLFARQGMTLEAALRLWLAYSMPYLSRLRGKPMLVVDYDRFMREPSAELRRIAGGLAIESGEERRSGVDRFTKGFLDERLRHTVFALDEIEASTETGRLTRDAYALLLDAAADRRKPDSAFWNDWQHLAEGHTSKILTSAEGTTHG